MNTWLAKIKGMNCKQNESMPEVAEDFRHALVRFIKFRIATYS